MEPTYIEETLYCNTRHPEVSHLAKLLVDNETDPGRITAALFHHVRDKIRFGFDLVQVKASETLAKGYGVCWNKALLLVALLRSNGIQARMAYNPVHREFMRPAMGDGCLLLPETVNHCFAQVHLNEQWTVVDATLDRSTFAKLFAPMQVTWGIDWNGSQDMQLYAEHVQGPVKVIEKIDAAIEEDVGNRMPPPSEAAAFFESANRHMWQAVAG